MRRLGSISSALAAAALLLSACAAKPPAGDADAQEAYREANDPLEPTNRKIYAVNDRIDRYTLRPAAVAYRDVVPGTVRSHVHNVLSNIGNPVQFTNDVLQGKPRKAGDTFMRFLINTTVGVGGLFEVATDWGYPDHDNDFGMTMALWGLPEGPFLFLPILGPSSPREGIGYGINSTLDPFTWASFGGSASLGWSRFGVGALDGRERVLDELDSIQKDALDPYATIRSLYRQHRAGQIDQARTDRPATVPAWFKQPTP
jgi:phospholipid-binding lipoprotein MlaA